MNNFHNSEAYASFFCAIFHQKSPPGRIPTGRRFHLLLIGFDQKADKRIFFPAYPLTCQPEGMKISVYLSTA